MSKIFSLDSSDDYIEILVQKHIKFTYKLLNT